MDTEEHIEIQKAIRNGHSQTDEGPYYHDSWWESYKGGVKGKLGGVVIGAIIGAVVGIVAAAVVSLAVSGVTLAAAAAVTAGFAAGGMLYGAHEFSDVGKITGAVSAAHEKSESRIKSFEEGKFSEIKKEIREIKNMLVGKGAVATAKAESPEVSQEATKNIDYRTTHCDEHCDPQNPQNMKWVFWKVAAVGLLVGLAAGALLVAGGVTAPLLEHFGVAAAHLSGAGEYVASMTALGLFGASFGINRDMFRKVFDNTDLLFKGIFNGGKGVSEQIAVQPSQAVENSKKQEPFTVVYDDSPENLKSTYHQDKVLASARAALLSMDPTKSITH